MTKCSWGFHKWGKWEIIEEQWNARTTFGGEPISEWRTIARRFEVRTCINCNKTQREEI